MIDTTKRSWTARSYLAGLLVVLVLAGCDEEVLGPQTTGEIQGQVREATSDAPVADANVTTSPPTQSIITDEEGRFRLGEVSTGDYTVEVQKSNYTSRSVTVSVKEGQTVTASILLEKDEDAEGGTATLRDEVVNWANESVNRDGTGPDSVFVEVEYSAENAGDVALRYYELYFSIETEEDTFSYEVHGDSLDVGQRDVGRFRTYVRHAPVQSVRLEDPYTEAGS